MRLGLWSLDILHTVAEPRTNGAQDTSPGLDREAGLPWVYSIKMTRRPIGGARKGRDGSPVNSTHVGISEHS